MTATGARGRNLDIDGLKLIAAAGIVLLHVAGTANTVDETLLTRFLTSVTYGSLFFFFCISGYLHGALGTRGAAWVRTRVLRLGVPYAVWSAAFLLRGQLLGQEFPPLWRLTFFAGAHEVLWSLPMLVICAALAEVFVRSITSRRVLLTTFGLLAIATCLFAPFAWQADPLRQFLQGARWPLMYLLGMEIRASAAEDRSRTIYALVAASMLLLGAVGAVDPAAYPLRLYGLGATAWYLVLAASLTLAVHQRVRVGAEGLAWGGSYLVGIYASHYLFLEILAKRFPPTALPEPLWIAVAWAVVFGAALGTSYLLSRSKYTKLAVA